MNEDKNLTESMNKLPMGEHASSALAERVRAEASRRRPTPRFRWAWAGTAVLAVGLFAAVALNPREAAAKAYDEVRTAVSSITSFYLKVQQKKEPSQPANLEFGYDGERLVAKVEGKTMVYFDGQTMQHFDEKKNTLYKVEVPSELVSMAKTAMTEYDVAKMLAEFEAQCGRENIEWAGEQILDGRKLQGLRLKSEEEGFQAQVWVDSETRLPRLIEVAEKKDGRLAEVLELDIQLNSGVKASLFEPEWPRDAKVEQVQPGQMFDGGFQMFGQKFD